MKKLFDKIQHIQHESILDRYVSSFEVLFTTKQQGTGLGLSGVKFIIESHGGIISVTSPPTIFTITLPISKD